MKRTKYITPSTKIVKSVPASMIATSIKGDGPDMPFEPDTSAKERSGFYEEMYSKGDDSFWSDNN